MTRRVLVTNDDGIDSPGVLELARLAQHAGYEVLLAAPDRQSSGSSGSLWFDSTATPLIRPRTIDGLAADALAIAAHPGLISLLAMTGQLGRIPDVVLSGINDASNLGSAVLHSGTANAALIAAAHGATAAAFSLYLDEQPHDSPRHWSTAIDLITTVIDEVITGPAGTVVSINVPNVPTLSAPLTRASWAPAGCAPTLLPFIESFQHARGEPVAPITIRRPAGTDLALARLGVPTVSTIGFTDGPELPWAATV